MRLKKNKLFLPSYSCIPLLLVVVVNVIAFWGTRLINGNFHHYNMTLPIDEKIPFSAFFIVIYILAYVQWAAVYVIAARDSREACFRILGGEIISKLICAVIFIILPTTMVRAEITGNDIFSSLTAFIYSADSPDNLFPSIHCLESWICFRAAVKMKKTGRLFAASNFIMALAVFASVLFVKQHVAVDIVGGIAAAEAGLLISGVLCKTKYFKRKLKLQ